MVTATISSSEAFKKNAVPLPAGIAKRGVLGRATAGSAALGNELDALRPRANANTAAGRGSIRSRVRKGRECATLGLANPTPQRVSLLGTPLIRSLARGCFVARGSRIGFGGSCIGFGGSRIGFGVALLGLLLASASHAGSQETPERFDVVVVDAGHGGDDDGAQGRAGLVEKTVVLDVAKRVERRLRAEGLEVVMTRDSDRFVPLEGRTELANAAGADLFISIHANASSYKGARGIETFFASPEATDQAALELARAENLAFGKDVQPPAAGDPLLAILGDMAATEQLTLSQEFARLTQHRIATAEAARSRGVKQAPFVVLMGVRMPAVLVEIGFLSHPADEEALGDEDERERLAKGIAEAVAAYRARYDARRGVARGTGNTRIR